MYTEKTTKEYIVNLSKKYNIKKFGVEKIKSGYGIPENEEIRLFWAADLFDVIYDAKGKRIRKRIAGTDTGWEIRMLKGLVLTDKNLYYHDYTENKSVSHIPTSSIQDIVVLENSDMVLRLVNMEEIIPDSLFFPKGEMEKDKNVKLDIVNAIADAINELR